MRIEVRKKVRKPHLGAIHVRVRQLRTEYLDRGSILEYHYLESKVPRVNSNSQLVCFIAPKKE